LDGSVPVVIFNPVEIVKRGLHLLPKLRKVPVLILVILGDTGKIKGEVSLFEGLSPLIQGLTDLFFIGSMAGPQEKHEDRDEEPIPSHSFFSVSSFG
jgi:hypothetical protein